MKITTKYGLGQTVFVKAKDRVETRTTRLCPGCEGGGTIRLKDESLATCPKCHGHGKIEKVVYSYKSEKRVIEEIRLMKRRVNCQGVMDAEEKLEIWYVMSNRRKIRATYDVYLEKDVFQNQAQAKRALEEDGKTRNGVGLCRVIRSGT